MRVVLNRAFISLYVVVVASVILVGWAADRFWQAYNPEPEEGPFAALFFQMVDHELQAISHDKMVGKSQILSDRLGHDIQIFPREALASSSLSEKIINGEEVTVFDDQGRRSTYKWLGDSNVIVRVNLDQVHKNNQTLYLLLLIAFYVVIAVMIYVWVWPLSRDMRKLQRHTAKVGAGVLEKVELGTGSTVYNLAAAFNLMAERIHELLASHKEMTYAVSHELRTPLARMKFALEMARESQDTAVIQRQIQSVTDDVTEMDELISELLTYAGFEQQNRTLECKPGDPQALIYQLVETHQSVYFSKNIVVKIDNQLGAAGLSCEWYLFERCLHNVIENAFKYAQKRIRITLLVDDKQRVIIEDDGVGVDANDREKIFQAFVRLRKSGDENKSGFGLGLAIVHRIMKWHGGGVELKPSDLGGAKFVLWWP